MQDILRLFIFLCGISFAGIMIRLLLRQKISTRNSVAWLFGAVVILILSAYPRWLDHLAYALGVSYPPTLMFLFSILVLLLIVLYQSMQISTLHEKIRQLAQHIALHDLDNHLLSGELQSTLAAAGKGRKSLHPDAEPASPRERLH